jgi:CheY-like chemotaxis protein
VSPQAPYVLVVEDDPDVRETLADTLREEGIAVDEAANGLEALECMRENDALPSVILLDLAMPVMDGRAFRDAQQRDPRLAAVPVILLSGYRDGGESMVDLRVAEVLEKPPRPDRLLRAVTGFLPPRS